MDIQTDFFKYRIIYVGESYSYNIELLIIVLMFSCQFNIGSTATWITLTRIVKQFASLQWTSVKLLTL